MISYRNAQTTADLVQDNALLSSMRIIGEDIDWDNGNVSIQIPPAALELFESPEQDSVFYRVEASGHRLLAGSPDLPVPPGAGDVPQAVRRLISRTAVPCAPLPTCGSYTTRAAPKKSSLRSRKRRVRATPWRGACSARNCLRGVADWCSRWCSSISG